MIIKTIYFVVISHPGSPESILTMVLTSVLRDYVYIFVVPLLMWIIASVTIYGVSRAFSGSGSLISAFRTTGYGMLPMNLYGLGLYLLTIGAFIAIGEVPGYSDNPVSRMMNVLNVIGLVFVFWSGYLWVVGTEKSYNLPRKTAIIPVACAFLLDGVVMVNWFIY